MKTVYLRKVIERREAAQTQRENREGKKHSWHVNKTGLERLSSAPFALHRPELQLKTKSALILDSRLEKKKGKQDSTAVPFEMRQNGGKNQ